MGPVLAICKLLVEHGSDITVENKYGETPFDKAIERGRTKTAKFLRDCVKDDDDTKSV